MCTCVWPAIVYAVSRTSRLKSLWSRFDVSRPTTSAKITRMISVNVAETAASRQRTGQRFGVSLAASRSSLFIAGRPDHVAGTTLRVKEPGLASRLQLAAQIGDEDVAGVGHRHGVVPPDLLEQALTRDH